MGFQHLFAQQDMVLTLTFAILVLMSILTWAIIIIRSVKLFLAKKANRQFLKTFWHAADLHAAMAEIQDIDAPMSRVATQSYRSQQQYNSQKYSHLHDAVPRNDYLVRHIRYAMDKVLRPFSGGLTALASVGATAPFIGLFGTVWGIYHALINISVQGQVTMGAVAAPIGEALIATAMGLFTAIPAVLAYNALVRLNKNLSHDMDNFAHDLYVQLLNVEQ
ncbi:MAG: MotA/TolQ/ExbB proton channel family protein [Neisseriaceae bacterium]|nr:MotA/TolQ/ExbB proton channel family protein [Neisseriaceae bacterium]